MKEYFKLKTWLITIIMFIIALAVSSAMVYFELVLKVGSLSASQDNNVSGWAWNGNTGWISFNCDHTADGTSPPTNDCGAVNYGVNLDEASGNFSGYAWSSNLGWISFNRSDTGAPPGQPYKNGSGNDPIASYNKGNGEVSGWAKILSLGDNGWIKLRKFSSDSGPDYGLSINSITPPSVENMIAPNWNYSQASADALRANLQFSYVNSSSGGFKGWAWNGGDGGIGWISFSCDHTDDGTSFPDNINTCGTADYNVVGGAVSGSPASSAYQIIINTQPNRNNPVFDSGKCTGYNTPPANPIKCKVDNGITGVTYFPLGDTDPLGVADGLNYGTAYYWWVKVWDENDNSSDWIQYDTSSDTDNDDGAALTFTTYKHEFPRPGATWFPVNPSRGEKVKFTDQSQRFFSAAPTVPVACSSATCDWQWIVPNGATIDDAAASTPTIIFNGAGLNSVKLKITDETDTGNILYYGEKNINVEVNTKLPKWKEVKPE